MANLKDLIVSGPIRAISGVIGDVTGTASKATGDKDGNQIDTTYVKTSRKVNNKALSADITLTYTDVGAASTSHTHSNYPSSDTVVKHTASTAVGNTITPIYVASDGTATALSYTIAKSVPADAKFSDTVYTHPTTSGNKHVPSGGTTNQILKWSSDGTATWANEYSYTHPTTSGNKHIPSGGTTGQFLKWSSDGTATWAADNNTTYSAGTGLSLSGTTFNHASSITAGTVGTSAATSGSTLAVPYVTYNASGHVTATGTHTHTITGFSASNHTHTYSDVGAASTNHTHTGYQSTDTAVTHTANTAVGNTITPVYVNSSGVATALSYTIAKSVPADAKFTDTVYTHPTTAGNKHIPTGGTTNQILKWSASGTATWANEYSYTHPTTSGNKHIPSGGSSGQILRWSADGTAAWGADNNTTYSDFVGSGSSAAHGLVPAPSTTAGTSKYLCENGTWATPPDTKYTHPTTSGNKHIPSGGTTGQFLKWSADGTATWAADNNTTYTAGTGLSLSGTQFKHSNSVTAGTVGTSAATSGNTLSVPYVTYDAQGHVTGTGTHTHTVTGFSTTDTKNTAGSTDTSSKIFLVGATSQAANPQTYSHDTVFVDTDGALNSVTPTAGNNTTKVATTAFVTSAVGNYLLKSGGTMTGAITFANNTWNSMGDDASIGDQNVGGHICIKPNNSTFDNSGGIQFKNSSGTNLVQLNASSNTLTSSGALGVSNNAAKMQYNSTTEAIEFVFA